MFQTDSLAYDNNVKIGAHPGFEDKEGFGRRSITLSTYEIKQLIASQVGALIGVAALTDMNVKYVKPHGALANWAAEERDVAEAITQAVKALDQNLAILAISGTELEKAAKDAGLKVFSEIFADRAYQKNGQLVPRSTPGAVICDADQICDRLLEFLDTGAMPTLDGDTVALEAHSVCIHGDTEGALSLAEAVRNALTKHGVTLASFIK